MYGVTKDATGCRDGDELAARAGLGSGGYRVRRIFSGQRIRNVRLEGEDAAQFSAEASPAQSTTSTSTSFAPSGRGGRCTPAAELVSIYHEESGVPAAVISLGACKGLMPYMRNLRRRRDRGDSWRETWCSGRRAHGCVDDCLAPRTAARRSDPSGQSNASPWSAATPPRGGSRTRRISPARTACGWDGSASDTARGKRCRD